MLKKVCRCKFSSHTTLTVSILCAVCVLLLTSKSACGTPDVTSFTSNTSICAYVTTQSSYAVCVRYSRNALRDLRIEGMSKAVYAPYFA